MELLDFAGQITALSTRYRDENAWFGFPGNTGTGGPAWSRGTWLEFIIAAYKLYKNASAGGDARMTVLGDTKIRSDPKLVFTFGMVANAAAPQEEQDKALVRDLIAQRNLVAADASAAATAIPLLGSGGILSAERWSPMLNDAMMIGGIEKHQEFHLGLSVDEQAAWDNLRQRRPGAAEFAQRQATFGTSTVAPRALKLEPAQEMWLRMFIEQPRMLWENGTPRVFARELMALKLFGYKAEFHLEQLSFYWASGGQAPSFKNYLDGLREVDFHNRNQTRVFAALSEFLFGNAEVLSNPERYGVV